MAFEDFYFLLGVSPESSDTEIRASYRRLVLRCHPDRNAGDRDAEETFKKISAAYKTLSNPGDRKKYDLRYLTYQESQRIKRSNEAAAGAAASAKARAPSPHRPRSREEADAVEYLFDAPIIQQQDAINGAAAGAFFSLVLGTLFVARTQSSLPTVLSWTLLAFPAAFLGQQAGSLFREIMEGPLESLPPWLEDTPQALPTLGSLLAVIVCIVAYRYFQVPVFTGGSIAAALGASLGGLFGSSFGRAFLSVAHTFLGKLVGYGVAAIIGAATGILLSPLFVLVTHGVSFNSAFFDYLFAGAGGGMIGGALASMWGGRRR